jgi:hypothetical protein
VLLKPPANGATSNRRDVTRLLFPRVLVAHDDGDGLHMDRVPTAPLRRPLTFAASLIASDS